MIDAEQPCAGPAASARIRKLQQLERVSVRVAEFDGCGNTRLGREQHRSAGGDRRRAESLYPLPGDVGIVGHDREMLETQVGGRRAGWIGPPRSIEAVEIDPLAAEMKRQSAAAVLQAQKGDLVIG